MVDKSSCQELEIAGQVTSALRREDHWEHAYYCSWGILHFIQSRRHCLRNGATHSGWGLSPQLIKSRWSRHFPGGSNFCQIDNWHKPLQIDVVCTFYPYTNTLKNTVTAITMIFSFSLLWQNVWKGPFVTRKIILPHSLSPWFFGSVAFASVWRECILTEALDG